GLDAAVAGEIARKRGRSVGLELARDQPVLRTQKCARQRWRAGIGREAIAGIEAGDYLKIGLKQRARARADRGAEQTVDARAPFQAAARLWSGKVVKAGTGMGIDDAESGRLVAQVHEDA